MVRSITPEKGISLRKKKQILMKWTELIENTAWVVEELLTEEECKVFIQKAEEAGINEKRSAGDVRHRHSNTVAIDDNSMAQLVYERIRQRVPQEVWVDEYTDNLGLRQSREALQGKWTPVGLNSRWRVVCYPGFGHFGPHRDGSHIESEHLRSLITLNGYLTDRPKGYGGATRFLHDDLEVLKTEDEKFTAPDDAVLQRVEADKAGKAVVFFHDLLHDGEPLKDGSPPKWLFRTEVMYERDPTTAPKLTCDQRKAREVLKQAEEAEKAGEIKEAIRLYKRAYRLDQALENSAS